MKLKLGLWGYDGARGGDSSNSKHILLTIMIMLSSIQLTTAEVEIFFSSTIVQYMPQSHMAQNNPSSPAL